MAYLPCTLISIFMLLLVRMYILISYSYCRVDKVVSKCFAMIIPLLSYQLTLIQTQSTYATMQCCYFLMHMPAIMYTYTYVLMQCVLLCNLVTTYSYILEFVDYTVYNLWTFEKFTSAKSPSEDNTLYKLNCFLWCMNILSG